MRQLFDTLTDWVDYKRYCWRLMLLVPLTGILRAISLIINDETVPETLTTITNTAHNFAASWAVMFAVFYTICHPRLRAAFKWTGLLALTPILNAVVFFFSSGHEHARGIWLLGGGWNFLSLLMNAVGSACLIYVAVRHAVDDKMTE
jgi:hypothetical protein